MRWAALCPVPPPDDAGHPVFWARGEEVAQPHRPTGSCSTQLHCSLGVSTTSKMPLGEVPFVGAGGPGRTWVRWEHGYVKNLHLWGTWGLPARNWEACRARFLLAESLHASVSAFLRVKCLSEIKKRESSQRMVRINLRQFCLSGFLQHSVRAGSRFGEDQGIPMGHWRGV